MQWIGQDSNLLWLASRLLLATPAIAATFASFAIRFPHAADPTTYCPIVAAHADGLPPPAGAAFDAAGVVATGGV